MYCIWRVFARGVEAIAINKWSYIYFFLTRFYEFLKEFLRLSGSLLYSLVSKRNVAWCWNTSLVCAGAVGIIQRCLKFCESLRRGMTFGIFFNWAQRFIFRNCFTIDMVVMTIFPTVGGIMMDWLTGNVWL